MGAALRDAAVIARRGVAMALGLAAALGAGQSPAVWAESAPWAGAPATRQLLAQAAVQGGRRLALVIGNGAYAEGPLPNAVNDAEDVSRTLRAIGFQVTLLKNGDQQAMEEAVDGFRNQLRRGDLGLFYFSGHGVQVAGESFLIPLGFKPTVEANVKYQSLRLNELVNSLEATDAFARVVILDACRNTLPRSWQMNGRNFAVRGLATPSDRTGTLIVYATASDKTAADSLASGSRNSPFTTFLLRHLPTPNLDIQQLIRRVRRDVMQATANQQTPWDYGALIDQIILYPLTRASAQLPDIAIGGSTPVSPGEQPVAPSAALPQTNPQPAASGAPPTAVPSAAPTPSVPASVSSGVGYSQLQKLLSKKNYKEADELTLKLLLASARSRNQDWMNRGWLESRDIQKLDCNDLSIVDKLWAGYSNNSLGLSVQSKIWDEARNSSSSIPATYLEFSRRVHWMPPSNASSGNNYISKDDINYYTPATGHLPVQLTYPVAEGWSDGGLYTNLHLLYARFSSCRKSKI